MEAHLSRAASASVHESLLSVFGGVTVTPKLLDTLRTPFPVFHLTRKTSHDLTLNLTEHFPRITLANHSRRLVTAGIDSNEIAPESALLRTSRSRSSRVR